MLLALLANNTLIWHVAGYIIYEIIFIPILYIVKYLYWIFVAIITSNCGSSLFAIEITSSGIINNFTTSPLFLIYLSCFSISLIMFLFVLLYNVIKTYLSNELHLYFKHTFYWLIITILLYPLIPIVFCILLLLINIAFNALGFSSNVSYITNTTIGNYEANYDLYKTQIINALNNQTFNKLLFSLNLHKLNSNSYYATSLIDNMNLYQSFVINNQGIFNKISLLLYSLKTNQANLSARSILSNDLVKLNDLNNWLININNDMKNLNLSSLSKLKTLINQNESYFNGTLINNLLDSMPNSLVNLLPHLGHIYQFNLIEDLESITGNNSKIIDWTPDFWKLNWDVIIAVIFAIAVLVVLFLYAILTIRKIVELIILFLISPIVFITNIDEKSYYFKKWLHAIFIKCLALILIALIFQTCMVIYPKIASAINSRLSNGDINCIIADVVVGLAILLACFFSINTILSIFDAREGLMEMFADLFSLQAIGRSVPFFKRIFSHKGSGSFGSKGNNPNYPSDQPDGTNDVTMEDILFQRVPIQTTGMEHFLASNKFHHALNTANSKVQSALFGKPGRWFAKHENKWINNFLNKHFKKFHMEDQKWKKERTEGPF